MSQATWDDFTESDEPKPEEKDPIDITIANDEECCPWCYAPEEFYHEKNGRTCCSICKTQIPVDTEWYQNGVKVVQPSDVLDCYLDELRARRSSGL